MNCKKIVIRILIILGIVVPIVFAALVAYMFYSFQHETHCLRKYVESRAKWNQELVGHFPAEIPTSASPKKLTYYPGFFQGGAYIQLRLRLPPEQIQELYSKFAAIRTKSFFGGDMFSHTDEKDGMPTTHFYTGDNNKKTFPDDFEIMIFDEISPRSQKEESPESPPVWNHGKSHGVAISTSRNEIVYWAENW